MVGSSFRPAESMRWCRVSNFVLLFLVFFLVRMICIGLQSGQALLVVPGYFVGNTMLAMVCSLLYQETYKYLTSLELVMFFVGFFTSIGGVVAMVWKEMGSDLNRTELWIARLAASPRARRSPTRTAGLPPRHQKLYEDQFVLDTPGPSDQK